MELFSIAIFETLHSGAYATIAAVLFFIFGLGLIISGIFTTDPALGYPNETISNHSMRPSVHGTIHGLAGLAVFASLPITAFVMGIYFFDQGEVGWGIYSIITGVLVPLFFPTAAALCSKRGKEGLFDAPVGLFQRASIIAGWTWISFLSLHLL